MLDIGEIFLVESSFVWTLTELVPALASWMAFLYPASYSGTTNIQYIHSRRAEDESELYIVFGL